MDKNKLRSNLIEDTRGAEQTNYVPILEVDLDLVVVIFQLRGVGL